MSMKVGRLRGWCAGSRTVQRPGSRHARRFFLKIMPHRLDECPTYGVGLKERCGAKIWHGLKHLLLIVAGFFPQRPRSAIFGLEALVGALRFLDWRLQPQLRARVQFVLGSVDVFPGAVLFSLLILLRTAWGFLLLLCHDLSPYASGCSVERPIRLRTLQGKRYA